MSGPVKLMFIRHAEKPDPDADPPTLGVLENGSADPKSLTSVGWQRARALAVLFGSDPAPNPKLPAPSQIYAAADDGDNDPSKRPLETVTPLAIKLNVNVNAKHSKKHFAEVLEKTLAHDGETVLVCWEHNKLAAGLADATCVLRQRTQNASDIPETWPGSRFDLVWVFDRRDSDHYVFSQVPQLLLDGDLASGIEPKRGNGSC